MKSPIKKGQMKKYLSLLLMKIILISTVLGQQDSSGKKQEFNIKEFWMVILKTGPKDKLITDSTERSRLFAGHFANINNLYYDGVLKVAGPFGENNFTWRGLFIFDCSTREEAAAYVNKDPTVKAGIFIYDIIPWYGEPTGSFIPGKPDKPKD